MVGMTFLTVTDSTEVKIFTLNAVKPKEVHDKVTGLADGDEFVIFEVIMHGSIQGILCRFCFSSFSGRF